LWSGIDPPPAYPAFKGTGLSIFSVTNFNLIDGGIGAQIEDSLADETFKHGHIEVGFIIWYRGILSDFLFEKK
jgi:hypothetical protein